MWCPWLITSHGYSMLQFSDLGWLGNDFWPWKVFLGSKVTKYAAGKVVKSLISFVATSWWVRHFYWILRSCHDWRCQQQRRSFLVCIAKEKHGETLFNRTHSMALPKPLSLAFFFPQTLCYLWVQEAVSGSTICRWTSGSSRGLVVSFKRIPGQLGLSHMILALTDLDHWW